MEAEGRDELLEIEAEDGLRSVLWRYPGRSECLACHTRQAGGALGFSAEQLDREGFHGPQLQALHQAGYLEREPVPSRLLSPLDDQEADLEERVRSYLHVNCGQCHRPGGEAIGLWDARMEAPLAEAGIVGGALANSSLSPARRVVVPGEPSASELLQRMISTGSDRMPPVATRVPDHRAIEAISRWISQSLPREAYQEWSLRHLGEVADEGGDADGDGMSNMLEYRLVTDPADSGDYWRLQILRQGDSLQLRFPAVSDPGLVLELEATSSLDSPWRTLDPGVEDPFRGERGTLKSLPLPRESDGPFFVRARIGSG